MKNICFSERKILAFEKSNFLLKNILFNIILMMVKTMDMKIILITIIIIIIVVVAAAAVAVFIMNSKNIQLVQKGMSS